MNIKNNLPRKDSSFRQGYFVPQNPNKYKGKMPILYRSSYEHKFMRFCDLNENIIIWSSESIEIPYFNPVAKSTWKYYVDFLVKIKDENGKESVKMVEVKPHKETTQPKYTNRKNKKTLLYEHNTWMVNSAKWDAAKIYCHKRGWEFIIMTEKELNIKP
jgi:hypothetical protein